MKELYKCFMCNRGVTINYAFSDDFFNTSLNEITMCLRSYLSDEILISSSYNVFTREKFFLLKIVKTYKSYFPLDDKLWTLPEKIC